MGRFVAHRLGMEFAVGSRMNPPLVNVSSDRSHRSSAHGSTAKKRSAGLRRTLALLLAGCFAVSACSDSGDAPQRAAKALPPSEDREYVELAEAFAQAIDSNMRDCKVMGQKLLDWDRQHFARFKELEAKFTKLPSNLWGRFQSAVGSARRAGSLCVSGLEHNADVERVLNKLSGDATP